MAGRVGVRSQVGVKVDAVTAGLVYFIPLFLYARDVVMHCTGWKFEFIPDSAARSLSYNNNTTNHNVALALRDDVIDLQYWVGDS